MSDDPVQNSNSNSNYGVNLGSRPLWEIECASEDATLELGRRIGAACRGGEIILAEGALGAGKTCLANGLGEGLGLDEPAASPTFVLMRSYVGRRGLTLHHLDFYRLASAADVETIGLEDCFADDAVVYIEWPDRCPGAVDAWTLRLRLTATGDASRYVRAFPGPLLPADSALGQVTENFPA
jgi:tRNA threonylcarbamoyladenosine biosynthesis protein TsaE